MKKKLMLVLLSLSLLSSPGMASEKKWAVTAGVFLGLAATSLTTLTVGAVFPKEQRCDEDTYALCCYADVNNRSVTPNDCSYTPDFNSNCGDGSKELFCLDGNSDISPAPYEKRTWANKLLYSSIAFLPLTLAFSIYSYYLYIAS